MNTKYYNEILTRSSCNVVFWWECWKCLDKKRSH